MGKTRLQKLESDFRKHEQESEELAVAIKNEHHEERIKKAKTINIDHPSNDFF